MLDIKEIWNSRYKNGGNSGDGSYNTNATFKANIINKYIQEYNINTVTEYGSGDGFNLALYNAKQYLGLDISQVAVNMCKEKYKDDGSKQFEVIDYNNIYNAELTLSLDVTFHILDRKEWELYINKVINEASKLAIFYSFPKAYGNAPHINDFDFEEYLNSLNVKYEKLNDVPPSSNSRFYIIYK